MGLEQKEGASHRSPATKPGSGSFSAPLHGQEPDFVCCCLSHLTQMSRCLFLSAIGFTWASKGTTYFTARAVL